MDIQQKFLECCEGCPHFKGEVAPQVEYCAAGTTYCSEGYAITCKNIKLCTYILEHLANQVKSKISTIINQEELEAE